MNTPITFELAKLMKEKEFRNFGCKIYHTENELRDFPNIPKFYPEAKSRKEIYEEVDIYLAPTIAEVVCWIYSKYQIWIQVSILKDDEWHYSIRRKNNNWNIEFPTKEKFTSLENAYEKAINIILNIYKPTS